MEDKTIKRIAAVFGIIFVVGSAAAFLLVKNYTAKFWISYLAFIVALCANAYGMLQTGRDIDSPSSGLFSIVAVRYALGVAAVIILFHCILRVSATLYAVIHLALFAFLIVRTIFASMSHEYIQEQDKSDRMQIIKAKLDTERVTQLLETAKGLPEDIRLKAEKILRPVEEKLRYSDPMQSEDTAEQAHEMESALDKLEEAMDSLVGGLTNIDQLTQKANAAIRKIDAYNRVKKLMK